MKQSVGIKNGKVHYKGWKPALKQKQQNMAQSLSQLYVHIIFHTKSTNVTIRKQDAAELYAYIGSLTKSSDSIPILINGVEDHLHILCIMSTNIALGWNKSGFQP